jgi:hypothetical protein
MTPRQPDPDRDALIEAFRVALLGCERVTKPGLRVVR